jgi:hypothetical protein
MKWSASYIDLSRTYPYCIPDFDDWETKQWLQLYAVNSLVKRDLHLIVCLLPFDACPKELISDRKLYGCSL